MRTSPPSDISVIKINTHYFIQQLRIIQCVIKERIYFRAHKKTQCYADHFPVLYLLLLSLSINSNLPANDCTIHVRCSFLAH